MFKHMHRTWIAVEFSGLRKTRAATFDPRALLRFRECLDLTRWLPRVRSAGGMLMDTRTFGGMVLRRRMNADKDCKDDDEFVHAPMLQRCANS